MKNLTILIILLCSLFLLAGCSGGDDAATTAEEAAPAAETTPATEAAPTETVATHDCDGACGMKDVPEDKLTEVGGKFFCSGCVGKAEEAAKEAVGHG